MWQKYRIERLVKSNNNGRKLAYDVPEKSYLQKIIFKFCFSLPVGKKKHQYLVI